MVVAPNSSEETFAKFARYSSQAKLFSKSILLEMSFFSLRVIYSIKNIWSISILVILLYHKITVGIAQLVRALDCGSRGRGFEPHYSPKKGCIISH